MIWLVVHTQPAKEDLVARLLKVQRFKTLYLHHSTTTTHARRTQSVIRPLFPRYLFAGLDAGQGVAAINSTMGVNTVLAIADQPLEVPQAVIVELRSRGDRNGLVILTAQEKAARRRWNHGEIATINGGPMEGLLAMILFDKGEAVRVWVDCFNRRVKMDVKPDILSPTRRSYPG